jgi:chromosomal replication initiation ATPase DnaA
VTSQLSLPLRWSPADGAGDFYPSDSNTEAIAWLDCGASAWGHHASLLIGPAKSGKTHLARIFAARFGGQFVSLRRSGEATGGGVYIFDDLAAGLDEISLFHTYNRVKEQGGAILLVAEEQPRDWPVRLPDLASRLAATPQVTIRAPDDALLGAVIIKQMRDRGWSVPPEVVSYLLPRIERSFAAVDTLVAALDQTAAGEKRSMTVVLAGQVLRTSLSGVKTL